LLVQLPRWLTVALLVALIGTGVWSYTDFAAEASGAPEAAVRPVWATLAAPRALAVTEGRRRLQAASLEGFVTMAHLQGSEKRHEGGESTQTGDNRRPAGNS